MNKICLYHRDADGCAAAAVIMLAFPDEEIEFVSVQYGEPPPDNLKGRHVIIVDFSYCQKVWWWRSSACRRFLNQYPLKYIFFTHL